MGEAMIALVLADHFLRQRGQCGTPLTRKEKATALEEGVAVVLCTTCAAEAAALPEEESEEFEGSA